MDGLRTYSSYDGDLEPVIGLDHSWTHCNVYSTKLNQDATKPSRSSSREMQLDVVVVGKSADILYLFGEPKLLIINPPCSQCLILPPMSSKNTSMCHPVTVYMWHPQTIRFYLTLFNLITPPHVVLHQSKGPHLSWSKPLTDAVTSPPAPLADCLVDGCLEVAGCVDVAGVGR